MRACADIDPPELRSVGGGAKFPSCAQARSPGAASSPDTRSPAAGPQPPRSQATATDVDAISATALLFDRLTAEARPMARRAALAYVATLAPANDYLGVFMADTTLITVEPFTTNVKQLRDAIDRVSATAPTNLRTEDPSRRLAGFIPDAPPTAGADPKNGGFAGIGEAIRREQAEDAEPFHRGTIERLFREMEQRMDSGYRALLDESNGQASIAALNATIRALGRDQGRKTIFYFSDALPVTARTKSLLDGLIVAANRRT